jgi:hypothetical protein
MINREHIEWLDTWVRGADDSTRPKVLLIGDSIVRGYYDPVQETFGEEVDVARLATSACVCAPHYTNELSLLLTQHTFAVVHFNNGLHGWADSDTAYGEALSDAMDFIVRNCSGSVIWAHTTPVRDTADLSAFGERNVRVQTRNRLAAAAAAARGLPVNDLYSVIADHRDCFSGDGVHHSPAGKAALGAAVTAAIRAQL